MNGRRRRGEGDIYVDGDDIGMSVVEGVVCIVGLDADVIRPGAWKF